jgi:arylsulfatase A-like enzyme
MKHILVLVTFALCGLAQAAEKPNVLFIAIDDLNHWVGHLGRNPQTKTPSIDRLAKMGVTFTKAYCTAPSCNPSRASLMSGLRPNSTGCYNNSQPWHPAISDDQLLNTHFAKAGYRVYGGEDLPQLRARRHVDRLRGWREGDEEGAEAAPIGQGWRRSGFHPLWSAGE